MTFTIRIEKDTTFTLDDEELASLATNELYVEVVTQNNKTGTLNLTPIIPTLEGKNIRLGGNIKPVTQLKLPKETKIIFQRNDTITSADLATFLLNAGGKEKLKHVTYTNCKNIGFNLVPVLENFSKNVTVTAVNDNIKIRLTSSPKGEFGDRAYTLEIECTQVIRGTKHATIFNDTRKNLSWEATVKLLTHLGISLEGKQLPDFYDLKDKIDYLNQNRAELLELTKAPSKMPMLLAIICIAGSGLKAHSWTQQIAERAITPVQLNNRHGR